MRDTNFDVDNTIFNTFFNLKVEVLLSETRQIANIKKKEKNFNTKYIKLNKTYKICWNIIENLPLFPVQKTLS